MCTRTTKTRKVADRDRSWAAMVYCAMLPIGVGLLLAAVVAALGL